VVIGFDELRLNGPRAGATGTQLAELATAGLLSADLPAEPARVSDPDELTAEVLGYLHGNCAHCHNGSPRASSALSLEHDVALVNTIGVETQASGQASGTRIVPGSPEESVLFQAFWRDANATALEDMPPVGVQELDAEAAAMLRDWISSLPAP
jgi:mono/diheme cytochrome c family protein